MKTFGVGETSRILKTDINTLKKWCYLFQSYLSSQANPETGMQRNFTIDDIRVFCYAYLHWEDDPDIEAIKTGLDSDSQYDNLPIDNTIKGLTPVFSAMPPDIDGTWRGVVFGGEFELGNLFESASSFKLAGDHLIKAGLENREERELFQPAMYSYRHALELYIKSVTGEEKNHSLKNLFEKLVLLVRDIWSQELPNWLHDLIKSVDGVDPNSTTFRYGVMLSNEELYADMTHIKSLMDWSAQVFKSISFAKDGLTYNGRY